MAPLVAISSPSMAESTEMAGVMMPSPKSSAAPTMTSTATSPIRPTGAGPSFGDTRASRAMMPPSPSLSARIRTARYFTVTTRVRLQTMSDTTPKTFSRSGARPCSEWRHSVMV